MVRVCTGQCRVCGPYLHPGQDRHPGGQLHPGHRHPHGGGAGHELGHGVPHRDPGRCGGYLSPQLAVFDPFRPGHRGQLAVLLPRFADRGRLQGGSGGQAQRGDHPGFGLCDPEGTLYRQKPGGLCPDHRRHPVYGAVKPPYQKCARDTPGRIFYSDSRCRVLFIRSSSGISSSLITVSICSSLSTSSSGKRLRTRSITVLR